MTRIIAVPLGYILDALYSFIDNYGITIVVFTVIIRLIILPLYAAQLRSMSQMQAMQPKIKEIQTKYANDSQMMNIKLQELYKEEKINPAMGMSSAPDTAAYHLGSLRPAPESDGIHKQFRYGSGSS